MSNQTTNTNGYLIRLEVLKMAKDMLEQDYHSRRETAQRLFEVQVADAIERKVTPPNSMHLPEFPSVDKIKAQARELYDFVTTK
jgi:hypothetical protein